MTERYEPDSLTCQPAGPDGVPSPDGTGQVCMGTPFQRFGHSERRYDAKGVALQAGGVLLLLAGGFFLVYQLLRWAPECVGPSFGPPIPRAKPDGATPGSEDGPVMPPAIP